MRYANRYTLRLCRSTRTRNASRSPASVRSTAMASLSKVVSTLGLIRFIRQDFGVAVRFNFCLTPKAPLEGGLTKARVGKASGPKGGPELQGTGTRGRRMELVRALERNTVSLQGFCGLAGLLR